MVSYDLDDNLEADGRLFESEAVKGSCKMNRKRNNCDEILRSVIFRCLIIPILTLAVSRKQSRPQCDLKNCGKFVGAVYDTR